MKSILITGANGYIASNIAENLKNDYNLTLTTRQNLEVTNAEQVDNFFKDKYFDVVFHTAIKGGSRLSEDLPEYVHTNLSMHFNILRNEKHYGKYISFGSGAELDRAFQMNESSNYLSSLPLDPYGISKNLIAKSGYFCDKFYNIRIFNIFNYNELKTRMIKGNILRYINNENISVFDNRYMDFMFFDDFMQIIKHYIESENPQKDCNCSYQQKYTLYDIAQIINNLDKHKVEIDLDNTELKNSYIGKYDLHKMNISLKGLISGIEECYKKIKLETNL
jgi:nucleoside-diphosphate-sugar epimerase